MCICIIRKGQWLVLEALCCHWGSPRHCWSPLIGSSYPLLVAVLHQQLSLVLSLAVVAPHLSAQPILSSSLALLRSCCHYPACLSHPGQCFPCSLGPAAPALLFAPFRLVLLPQCLPLAMECYIPIFWHSKAAGSLRYFPTVLPRYFRGISAAISTEYPKETITRSVMRKWHSRSMS